MNNRREQQQQQQRQANFNGNENENVQWNQIMALVQVYLGTLMNILGVVFEKLKQYVSHYICFSEKSVQNQIVLITGAGGYLGRALALEFARRNAILVLVDKNEQENKKTQERLKENGFNRVHTYTADLTDYEALTSVCKKIKSEVGFVPIVVMAAAPTFNAKSILELNYKDDIESHFKIGYVSQLWMIQEFLKPMLANDYGHFITISSSSAVSDIPLIAGYASMKLAQSKLLESLRAELTFNGVKNVKTTVAYLGLLTGGIATGFQDSYAFDKSVVVTADEAAKAVVSESLKNKDIVFFPKFPVIFSSTLKHLISPRLLDFFVSLKCKINPGYLKLKSRLD